MISADWDAPANVRGFTTTRVGGVSGGALAEFNLGDHVGDAPQAVTQNRQLLHMQFALPAAPKWLDQVHGATVVDAEATAPTPQADASFAHTSGVVCAVLTADCLPVLLCDTQGKGVAAAHCGWRGLAAGILPATIAAMGVDASTVMAWLGPAIGPRAFEVGEDVYDAFVTRNPDHARAFVPGKPGKQYADVYALARRELNGCGVTRISGGDRCTVSESDCFYSYRRDGTTGRMASVIWLETTV